MAVATVADLVSGAGFSSSDASIGCTGSIDADFTLRASDTRARLDAQTIGGTADLASRAGLVCARVGDALRFEADVG